MARPSLARAKRATLRHLASRSCLWVSSLVRCRVCGYISGTVIPADSPHVKIRVEDVQCGQCYLMEASTVAEG